jgi:hypothetical protein
LAVLPVQGEADLLISVTGENWLPGDDSLLVQIEAPQSHQNLPPIQKEAKVTSGGAFLAAFILTASNYFNFGLDPFHDREVKRRYGSHAGTDHIRGDRAGRSQ